MEISPLIIALCVLLAVSLLIMGLRSGPNGSAGRMAERLDTFRDQAQQSPETGKKEAFLKQRSYSGLPGFSTFLRQFRGPEKVAIELERAGIPLRLGEYYIVRWGVAGLLLLIPFIFNGGILGLVFGIGLAVLGYMLPPMYVAAKKKARSTKINAQLVEMLGMVSNSLKSGYGLMQSLEFSAKQIRPPLAMELRRMLRDANLGMSAEDALMGLNERIDSADLDMVLTAINIQRAVGGNLAEILENVAATMRDRERICGEIRTLTAQQRMTGIIIGGLPVGMGLLFFVINPDYMMLLFTETVGLIMLAAAIGLEVIGTMTLKRILAIDV